MKHLNYISISLSCLSFIFLSISCRKDSQITSQSACTTCNHPTLSTLLIKDSNWVRQEDGSYTSDITKIIENAGASVSQIYGMNISNENILQEIYPEVAAGYMDGVIYGSVDLSKNHGTCTLTFAFSEEEHQGEVHLPPTSLPFNSVEIEVLFVKQNN